MLSPTATQNDRFKFFTGVNTSPIDLQQWADDSNAARLAALALEKKKLKDSGRY